MFTNVSVRGPICQCTAGFEQYNNGLNHFCPFAQGLAWPADAEPVGKAVRRSSRIHPHANMHADDKRGKWSEGDTAGTCTRRSRRPCKSSSFQDALQNTRYRSDGQQSFLCCCTYAFYYDELFTEVCLLVFFTHTHTHTFIRISCIYVVGIRYRCIYAHLCTYVLSMHTSQCITYMHAYAYTHTFMNLYVKRHAHTHACMHAHTHQHTHACMHARTHTHTHKHTKTHTRTCTLHALGM